MICEYSRQIFLRKVFSLFSVQKLGAVTRKWAQECRLIKNPNKGERVTEKREESTTNQILFVALQKRSDKKQWKAFNFND